MKLGRGAIADKYATVGDGLSMVIAVDQSLSSGISVRTSKS